MYPKNHCLVFIISMLIANVSYACDPCALFNASRLHGHKSGSFTMGVSEQYTEYDRAKNIQANSMKNGELVKGFSTTQIFAGYDFTENIGAQINVPIIGRRFTQIENFRTSSDTDGGLGDISLLGSYSLVNHFDEDWRILLGFYGGIKLPTGDTGTLKDIDKDQSANLLRHHAVSGASGGRALTRGTGSYDYILGTNLLTRYRKIIFLTDAQYTIRTEGDFDYEFADDFLWSAGPGVYLALDHEFSLALRVALLGEHKGRDRLRDNLVTGSQVSNLYMGPELLMTLDDNIGSQLGVDFRITDEDKDAQVVPDARIRFAVSYRF